MSEKLAIFVAETGQYGLELYGEALERTHDPDKALQEARRSYNRMPTRPPSEDDEMWKLVDEAMKPKAEVKSESDQSTSKVRMPKIGASPFKKPLT